MTKKTYTFNEEELLLVHMALQTQIAALDALKSFGDLELPKKRKILVDLSVKLLPF
jgi:hypothetical protein